MRLNRKQSGVVYVALAVLTAMLAYPPFILQVEAGHVVVFSFVGIKDAGVGQRFVDVPRLFCMCLSVIVAASGLIFALRDRN